MQDDTEENSDIKVKEKDGIKVQAKPSQMEVSTQFENNQPISLLIANNTENKIKGKITLDFPPDIVWKTKEKERTGVFEGPFSIPPSSKRKLSANIRYLGELPMKTSAIITVETEGDFEVGHIINLDCKRFS